MQYKTSSVNKQFDIQCTKVPTLSAQKSFIKLLEQSVKMIPICLHSGPSVRPALLSVFFARMSEGVQLQQQLQAS